MVKEEILTMDGKTFVTLDAVLIGRFFIVMFDKSHIRTYQLPEVFDISNGINLHMLPYTDNINI